jgi:hypothetical protein
MKPTIAITIAALFAATGCAEMRTVHCDVGPIPVDGRAKAKWEEVNVYGKNKRICWELQDPNYIFQADSIQIVDPKGEAFDNCKKGDKDGHLDGTTLISCKDKNVVPGRYKYDIQLYDTKGTAGPRNDPWVVNN